MAENKSRCKPETRLIAQYMRDCAKREETATYEGMASAAGISVSELKKRRGIIEGARKICVKEWGIVLDTNWSIGYSAMSNEDKSKLIVNKRVNRIRSQVDIGREELETVDTAKLSARGKQQNMAALTQFSLIEFAVDEKTQAEIAAQTIRNRKMFDYREHLDDTVKALLEMRAG